MTREHIVQVASHVRNPADYYNRCIQDWHMNALPKDFDAIDLDLVGHCHWRGCREPLYVIEATANDSKHTSMIERTARRLGVPALLVVHDGERFSKWRLVSPQFSDWLDEQSCVNHIGLIRRAHDATHHVGVS